MTIEKKEIAMGKWIALDGGTTHTRIRLMNGERIVAEVKCPAGAGDTARTGTIATLRDAVLLSQSGIVNESRYRTKTIPSAGALLKEEDSAEKQQTFEV